MEETVVGGALTSTFAHAPAGDPSLAPDWERLRSLPLAEFAPVSQMTRTVTPVDRPMVPAIDCHNHLGKWLTEGDTWMTPSLEELLATMDEVGVERIVNLDGRWGEELSANIARYDAAYPGRFVTFCHLDWAPLTAGAGADEYVRQVEDAHRRGARGIKLWKDLGLAVRTETGALAMPDDPRVVAACRRAGELGMVVLIHTADPVAFFRPVDEHNERLEELSGSPEWWFGDTSIYPTFEALMGSLEGLVAGAPGCAFIGAHVGGYAENLTWVGRMFAEHANFHVDLGGRLSELGRQPRAFASLVRRWPERVLFGTDSFPVSAEAYRAMYRFLETEDEHWPYCGEGAAAEVPWAGRWAVSGAGLPMAGEWGPGALEQVYRGNALRLGL